MRTLNAILAILISLSSTFAAEIREFDLNTNGKITKNKQTSPR